MRSKNGTYRGFALLFDYDDLRWYASVGSSLALGPFETVWQVRAAIDTVLED